MEYSKIVAISGLEGLYEIVSSKNEGAVVRAINETQSKFVTARTHSFSTLEKIEVFTTTGNVNLIDIFKALQAADQPLPNLNEATSVQDFFKKIYPTIDLQRVYKSDLRKMIKWFTLLTAAKIELKQAEEPTAGVSTSEKSTITSFDRATNTTKPVATKSPVIKKVTQRKTGSS